MIKKLLFGWLILFYTIECFGQMKDVDGDTTEYESPIFQPNRVEFEYESSDRDFHVVTAHEKGIMVVQETETRSKEGFVWKTHLLDTALGTVWTKDVIVKYGWRYIGYDFNQTDFILLFSSSEYNSEEMVAMQISYDGESLTTYEIDTVIPLELSHFEVVDDALIFGGEATGRPAIVYYNLKDQKPKVLPGIYNNNSSIVSIQISDKYKLFSVLISEPTVNKDYTISLKLFSSKGELIFTSQLETESEKSLVDAVSTYFSNGTQIVSGTYSTHKTDHSLGFYLARLKAGEQEFIKYHSYGDLYNFFSYMKDKQEDRVKKRIDRKKIRGKSVKLNYHLLVHDIVRRGKEFILIGEAYYPKYAAAQNMNSMVFDPYAVASQYDNSPSRLLGYQFTHAVVVGFNADGDILWDNSFEIRDVLLPYLDKNILVSVESDKIIMLYLFEDAIRSRTLVNGELVEDKTHDPIQLKYDNDELKEARSDVDDMKEWYGKSFFAYGTHRIKNTVDHGIDNNRKVFYINKITLK